MIPGRAFLGLREIAKSLTDNRKGTTWTNSRHLVQLRAMHYVTSTSQTLVNKSVFLEAHPDQPMCSAKHTRFYWRTWPRCRKILFN
jgi:hypothetical protein